MLEERTDDVTISFNMPRYEEHVNFVLNHPYIEWYIIYLDDDTPIGNIYLNQDNSWGYFIKREYQGKGYGTEALQQLVVLHPEPYYYANINPSNDTALHQAKDKFKGKLIQETYKIKRDDILNLE
jgi:predicted acetyltransferase